MSNAQKEFIGSADMSIVGAQRQDLVLMPLHRVDIWQRPADGHKERGELSDFYLGCLSDFDHFAPEVKAGHLKLKFSDAIYARLREACGQGFQTLEAIISQIIPFAKSSQEVANRLMLLVMGGQLSYTRTPPKFSQSEHTDEIGKIRFLHAGNAARFANVEAFVHTTGSIAIDGCGMVIPFDQKTSAVMAALTKVHESMVAEYCADIWVRADTSLDMDALVKEFKFVLGFFRRHYLGKFLAMGIVDRVLVDRVHNRNGDTWNRK